MWFKNLQIFRLPSPWAISTEQLEASLTPYAFGPGTSMDMQKQGWDCPRQNDCLVHTVNRQILIVLTTEKKLLPATVINQVAKAKAVEFEEQQGFKPGRKQMRELKEQVADELLPRAFSIRRSTHAWIDPINGWLVVDAASPAKADELMKLLHQSIADLPTTPLDLVQSPVSAMTQWLASGEAPYGFTVDQEAVLQSSNDSKASVRYVRHTLEPDDIRRHIAAGKQCIRLALTWSDRVSFVLTENLILKRIAPLDVLTESADSTARNDDERFDSDFALMTGELNNMLVDLVAALGGEEKHMV